MSKGDADLIASVRACDLCSADLPLGPRPVFQVSPRARVLIAGQAPGTKVHASGVPFDDPSGARLRAWMSVDRETFYSERIAFLPMGFCYPGKGKSGDLPPLPRCAATWRQQLLATMPALELTLVIGKYAQDWHLAHQGRTLTQTVQDWQSYGESQIPLPHPSPRNNIWLKKNPWFDAELVPVLQTRVAKALAP